MKPTRIFVHCSATADGDTLSVNAIRRYHVKKLGWSAIGYHALIERVKDGAGFQSYETIIGRPWHRAGAHARGHNGDSLAVCLVGKFDTRTVPAGQWAKLLELVNLWRRIYHIPVTRVFLHRDVSSTKSCPGWRIRRTALRADLRGA